MNKRQQPKLYATALQSRGLLMGGLCAAMVSFAFPALAETPMGGWNLLTYKKLGSQRKSRVR